MIDIYSSGGFINQEDAKIFIESELGENTISQFEDIEKKQLLHKRVSLSISLETVNKELDIYNSKQTYSL